MISKSGSSAKDIDSERGFSDDILPVGEKGSEDNSESRSFEGFSNNEDESD